MQTLQVLDITDQVGTLETAAPKLSRPSKMPCKSWSLEAGPTCPGKMVDVDGSKAPDPICLDCYAQKGRYGMDNVKAVRAHNLQDWQKADWEQAMIVAIGKRKRFRLFDSGDCYSVKLAWKLYRVMKACPNTEFWFPTRTGRLAKFADVLAKIEALPNVVVRHSAHGYDNLHPTAENASMVYTGDNAPTGVFECQAYKTASGTCRKSNCFACWDKSIKHIGYPAH